ncbi:hypothetical protein ACLESO_29885, partial [Pyxidicoccus sp. 3LG]
MHSAERQTVHRWTFIWTGALVALVGFILLGVAISDSTAWAEVSAALGLSLIGWGGVLQVFNSAMLAPQGSGGAGPLPGQGLLFAGTAVWLAGWGSSPRASAARPLRR